ncbi:MAG: hypothetical protein ACRD5Z_16030 [Bryobacteraceae bacterium]
MKTAITSSNAAKKIPPFSALLLALALFFSIAAWRVMSHQDGKRHPVSPEVVPNEVSPTHSATIRAHYQAQRHEAVAVGGSSRGRHSEEQSRAEFDPRGPLTRPDADRREGVWN